MTQPIISVENLSKAYRLGAKEETPDTLIGAAKSLVTAPVRNFRELSRLNTFKQTEEGEADDRTLWALKGVSFDVREGEVVGVIGRNGAGKSTLLKILSRITEPTSGRAVIRGRVSSLLEVGTGFHPELSGRDNVYMNGTILGMTKREIDSKFDEIVDFSGVEKFLDTPIKRYSSGMQVRLAFAVAAHLEPEILIVDEVLAVGDMEFQKKCLGKMKDVASGGRTVLFVSHNMSAVQSLCSRCVVLRHGSLLVDCDALSAIGNYMRQGLEKKCSRDLVKHPERPDPTKLPPMRKVTLESKGLETSEIGCGEPLTVHVEFEVIEPIQPVLGIVLRDALGRELMGINNRVTGTSFENRSVESGTVACTLDSVRLMPGTYSIDLFFGNIQCDIDVVHNATSFDVVDADFYGSGKLPPPSAGAYLQSAAFSLT